MATIKLVASAYSLQSSSYFSVSNAANAYTDTDSSTYATFQTTSSSTSNRYFYLKGFNFSDIPNDAIINSFTIRIKGYENGASTSSSYAPSLCNDTSLISGTTASSNFSTSVSTKTIPTDSLTWDDIVSYGSNLAIRVNARRSSRNTVSYIYIYGAEIEVDYTIPVYHSVSIQNSTSSTVEASNINPLEGDDVIILADTLTNILVTDNGTDVTNQFVYGLSKTISAIPGNDFTTGFSDSSANFYQSSSTTGTSWLEYAIGHSAEDPYSTSNTSNTYVKGNTNSETGWINYEFDFSEIPAGSTINSVSVSVYGARENSTIDSTHRALFQCYSGNTAKGASQEFTSTSNNLVELSNVGTWTAEELHNAILRFEVGYYGGRMLGITWTVVFVVDGYAYTITSIAANHVIVVSIAGNSDVMYFKSNGSWVSAEKVYKKINGSWVLQSNLATVFDQNTNYVKG